MARPKYEYKQVKIADLLLNPSNPRFNPVKHQTETILAMVEDQQSKLVALAEHIIDNGLNPTDIILVRPYKKQWLVLEGNRRVTALKLANEPELVPAQYSKLKKDFQKLNAILDTPLVENVPCVIIEDEALANEWIRLKHTGENEGAGTVRWDGQQTSRFSYQTSGTSDPRIVFLDALKELEEIPREYKDHFISIKKTNFDRLMGDPDVRNLVGVENVDGSFELTNGVNAYLLEVLYDLAFTDFSVGNIYRKDDRKKYISSIIERVDGKRENALNVKKDKDTGQVDRDEKKADKASDPQSVAGQEDQPEYTGAQGPASSPDATAKQKREKSYPVNRKTLIPAQHKLSITHGRIVKIFNELKSLDVEIFPNAVAVLFRVFIELSADCYISKNNIPSVDVDSRLSKKIEAVSADLETKKILTKHELRAARQMSSSDTQNSSIRTFHSYVHNKDVTPSSTDLKSAWDDLWLFIDGIWR